MTHLNYGLQWGSFEFDLDDGEDRYFQTINIEGASLTRAMLLNMLHFALDVMDDYYPGVMRIINADADPEETIELLKSRQPAANDSTSEAQARQ